MPRITLVTACMNRDAHLRAALPHWLQLPGIAEVVVVDWSNHEPLKDLTLLDERVKVVRAEGEPKWVLSYAYNLGISRATSPVILKCDSDCLPHPGATELEPGANHFYAGYWKSGLPAGKPSVNGQCLFAKSQFDAVNGYSEYIRTYGRDDEDFYERLAAAGFARQEIAPAQLDFLPHPHEARMAHQSDPAAAGVEAWLKKDVVFNEMRNAYLAKALRWDRNRPRAPFTCLESSGRWEVVQRNAAAELVIPPIVAACARLSGLRYVVAKIAKLQPAAVAQLDERACVAFLAKLLASAQRAA